MRQADDLDILALALNDDRMLITNDKDFGERVYRTGRTHHGVLQLRPRNESSANRDRAAKSLLGKYADRLARQFVVATESHVRIRSAPQ